MKYAYAALCVVLMVCLCAVAQDAAPAAKAGGKTAAKDAGKTAAKSTRKSRAGKTAGKPAAKDAGKAAKTEGKTAEGEATPEAAVEIPGDVITLKSGATLKGVQLVEKTPVEVLVDVGTGVILKIPRKQVVDIKLDNIEPAKRGPAGPPGQKEASLFPGSKLTPELSDALSRPLPEPLPKYENADLVTALGELGQRSGVTIVVDDAVKAIPAAERAWSFEGKPGMNLITLLQEDLLQKHKQLAVVYQYDKLLVTTKEKASALASQEMPPVPPPPPGAPPAAPPPGAPPAEPPPGAPPAEPPPGAPPVAPPPGAPPAEPPPGAPPVAPPPAPAPVAPAPANS